MYLYYIFVMQDYIKLLFKIHFVLIIDFKAVFAFNYGQAMPLRDFAYNLND